MTALEPLPPLVPDSPTATLLFDVWSGHRIVRGYGRLAPEDEGEVAAAIAAQMHLRAGSNVMVFDRSGGDLVPSYIRRFVPESSIWFGERDDDINPEDEPLIFLASKEAHLRQFYFFFDLVIFMSGSGLDQEIGPAFIAGDQLLTFAEKENVKLVDDSPGREMPTDVAFAGGVGR